MNKFQLALNVKADMNEPVQVAMPKKPRATTFEKEFAKKANANLTVTQVKELVAKRQQEIIDFEKYTIEQHIQKAQEKGRAENRQKAYERVHKYHNKFSVIGIKKFMTTFEGIKIDLVDVMSLLEDIEAIPAIKTVNKKAFANIKDKYDVYAILQDIRRNCRKNIVKPTPLTLTAIINDPANANLTMEEVRTMLTENEKAIQEYNDLGGNLAENVDKVFYQDLLQQFKDEFVTTDEKVLETIFNNFVTKEDHFKDVQRLKAVVKAIRRLIKY